MNYFKLEEQLLTKQNEKIIASGDVNVDICTFEFDAAWDGYVKTAVFYQNKDNVSYAVLNEDNTCTIPAGAMANAAPMFVGIFGIKGSKIMTSTVENIEILEGAISGITIDVKPSEDIFLAIIAQYQTIAEQMNEYDIKADGLQKAFDDLSIEVNDALTAQDERLDALKAFDVVEVLRIANEVQAENMTINERLDIIDLSVFTIPNVSIIFSKNIFKIEDARIKPTSLVDVYFASSTYSAASSAKVSVESFHGYIEFICESEPKYPILASVIVRSVN